MQLTITQKHIDSSTKEISALKLALAEEFKIDPTIIQLCDTRFTASVPRPTPLSPKGRIVIPFHIREFRALFQAYGMHWTHVKFLKPLTVTISDPILEAHSALDYLGTIATPSKDVVIKHEPMLWQADLDFARKNGGPLTKAFLSELLPKLGDAAPKLIIDSRVHMLMPGMWPCIPGWHHDDIPRTRADKQPNYFEQASNLRHFMTVIGSVSPTEFAVGDFSLEIPSAEKIYKCWSPKITRLTESSDPSSLHPVLVLPNHLIEFDANTLHRGTEATSTGFRFFIRATLNSTQTPKNEMRHNANVYMKDIEEGW